MISFESDMSKKEAKGIIVDLDAILDTRLAVLHKMSPRVTEKLLRENRYINRQTDNFLEINHKVFKEHYKYRTKEDISTPIPTKMMDLIGEFIVKSRAVNISEGGNGIYTFYLNVYPYDFNSLEQEMLIQGIVAKIKHDINVQIVSFSLDDYDPSFLKENIDGVVSYHGQEIIEHMMTYKNLQSVTIPETTFLVPDILPGDIVPGLETNKLLENIAGSYKPFVNLIHIDVKLFSLI